MPFELGLLSSQQDSFEQHEELSKLLNETDVFYVPLRNEFNEHGLNINPDVNDLTKCFDEDLSNKHLVVTFRDIGYSLCLDSVESIPDENDQSKIRVSGKMIVDGICIQFFGCFDYGHKTKKQILGVGRIELDAEYYRELSAAQVPPESMIKEENDDEKDKTIIQPIIMRKTRQQTARVKERTETSKPKTRSRTTSESLLTKNVSTSPPISHSSISSTRSHMPYPLRSPRTKQHPTSSPVHSSVLNNVPEYPLINSSSSMEPSQTHRIQLLSHTPHYSSTSTGQPTMPIQIPTSSNTGIPTASLPQMTNLIPLNQSHSLPAYIFPPPNIAYIATSANQSGGPFDLSSLPGNTNVFLITTPNQHPSQPVHILAPIDHRSFHFAQYAPQNLYLASPHPIPPQVPSTRTSNILQSTPNSESSSILQNKRHDNEEDKLNRQALESNKQSTEQLPFKKRRYTGQHTRMPPVHNDDGEVSDESVKK